MPPLRPAWRQAMFVALGAVFTALGVAGLLLPVMPGTVFLLLALACFSRGSPRLALWLRGHRWLGAPIRRWQATRCIPPRVKMLACLSMLAGFLALSSRQPGTLPLCLASALILAGMASVLWQRSAPGAPRWHSMSASTASLGGFLLFSGWLICQRPW